jgi:hypothetical protein
VLAAIQFDNQFRFEAHEIANVRTERSLPAKFEAANLSSLEAAPEQPLGIGAILAQGSSEAVHAASWSNDRGVNKDKYSI